MYLWLLMLLVLAVSEAFSDWEPCKVQCDNNFKRNDIGQQTALITVCQRGCDLFTVAFISTSQVEETTRQPHPKVLPQIQKLHHNAKKIFHPKKILKSKNTDHVETNSIITGASPPSTLHTSFKENKNAGTPGTAKILSRTKGDSESKTTVEPSSQPVQDHPVEASKQSTTTNGPRRANSKTSKLTDLSNEMPKNKDLKIINGRIAGNRIRKLNKGINKVNDTIIIKDKETKEASFETFQQQPQNDQTNFKGKLEQAKHSCRHACVSAYGGASEQEACVVGCHLQATTTSLKPIEDFSKPSATEYRTPLAMFQHVFFSLAGQVGRLVRITWSWASPENSKSLEAPEKIQVYGSEGLGQRAEMPLFIGLKPDFVEEQHSKRTEAMKNEENHAMKLFSDEFFRLQRPLVNSISINSRQSSPGVITIIKEKTGSQHLDHNLNLFANLQLESKLDERLLEYEKTEGGNIEVDNKQQSHTGHEHQQIQHQLDLLECISRKSGLPRWFIAITIFASALVVLWLCFSLTAPPDDIKVVKTKPPELESFGDDDDDYDDDVLSCNEKKKLLPRADDVIKIHIENV